MYTITLHGNSSELSCDIFPPLEVNENAVLCLLSLQTNHSIPNIEPGCNTIGFRDGVTRIVTIPTGAYELASLAAMIRKLLPPGVDDFRLEANKNTLKCLLNCSHDIDFTIENNISKLLGFKNKIYSGSQNNVTVMPHESDELVNIMKINTIKVECNLISGSFSDGLPSQTVHEFFPSVPPGYKIIEVPRHLVYYPLNTTSINQVNITLKDQDDNLINLRGEPITIRLQIHNGSQV